MATPKQIEANRRNAQNSRGPATDAGKLASRKNSLKHGLAPKIEGGKIQLRTSARNGRLHIEIEDNGVGISEEKMPHVYVEGIGLSNVRERLRVLYGTDFELNIQSTPGKGTLIRIEIPEVVSTMQTVA